MKRKNVDLRNVLEWGFVLCAAGCWLTVLILVLSGWHKQSIWVILLVTLVAVALTVCSALLRRDLIKPMKDLTEVVANWSNTAPEDLETQLADISGPIGDLGEVFQDQMSAIEERMASIKEATRNETIRTVQTEIAVNICQSILPRELKDYPSRQYFELSGLVRQGRQEHFVFYDFFFVDPGLVCVSIGHVEGQGAYAAIFMALAQSIIRSRLRLGRSLAEMMEDVNAQMYDYGAKREIRVLVGTLDAAMGHFSFVNAGVCPPMLMRNEERYEKVESAISTPLGRNENVSFLVENLRLRQGDQIFFYTEGLNNARDHQGVPFGEKELRATLNRSREYKDPEPALQYVADEAAAYCPTDDSHPGYAALLLEYRKGEKELAHCRVPAVPASASEVTDFLKSRFEDNRILPKNYARIAVLVDELFALCCRKVDAGENLVVECGVAPDAQSVTIRITGQFHGENPLEDNEAGPSGEAADYIQNHGDFVSFRPGEDSDAVSVVCFV